MSQPFDDDEIDKNCSKEKFVEETANAFRDRYMKEFLDVIFLFKIEESGETSCFDFLKYLHNEYDLMGSPGTVYALAYSMQRDKLIEGKAQGRKTVFDLTPKGKLVVETIKNSKILLKFCFADFVKTKGSDNTTNSEITCKTPIIMENNGNCVQNRVQHGKRGK